MTLWCTVASNTTPGGPNTSICTIISLTFVPWCNDRSQFQCDTNSWGAHRIWNHALVYIQHSEFSISTQAMYIFIWIHSISERDMQNWVVCYVCIWGLRGLWCGLSCTMHANASMCNGRPACTEIQDMTSLWQWCDISSYVVCGTKLT